MIGNDISAALPELRAQAESLMLDTVRIERRSVDASGNPRYVTEHGRRLSEMFELVYEGPCKLRKAYQERTAAAGEVVVTVGSLTLDLPVGEASGRVRSGDFATITSCVSDPSSAGRRVVVERDIPRTFAVERRLVCSEVSGD